MRHEQFVLPSYTFVAGNTREHQWKLLSRNGSPFNADGCTGSFALVEYSRRYDNVPLLTKPLEFIEAGDTIKSTATVTLLPDDTKDLSGKYIYQITIKDVDNEVEIPGQGIFLISKNTNVDFLS